MGKTAKELSEADTFTLLSPSFVLVLLFFLLPVGIIALMSFTNLSTDTGFDQ